MAVETADVADEVAVEAAAAAEAVAFDLRLFFVLVEVAVVVWVAGACANAATVLNPRTSATALAIDLKWFFIFVISL